MALYDNPEHACSVYDVTSGTDAGGGVSLTYTLSQSGIPCSINLTGASRQERHGREVIVRTYSVGFLGSAVTLTDGCKLVTSDSRTLHVTAFRTGYAYGGIDALTYAEAEEVVPA